MGELGETGGGQGIGSPARGGNGVVGSKWCVYSSGLRLHNIPNMAFRLGRFVHRPHASRGRISLLPRTCDKQDYISRLSPSDV